MWVGETEEAGMYRGKNSAVQRKTPMVRVSEWMLEISTVFQFQITVLFLNFFKNLLKYSWFTILC